MSYPIAFPNGGNAGLLPGIDLEMWGVPTSSPEYDPSNHNFVYLRFQRGIMMYDATPGGCICTQAILLADYLKSIITGQNLPSDLNLEAQGSPFYKQYAPNMPNWVRDSTLLPNTDLTNAFTPSLLTPTPSAPTVSMGSATLHGTWFFNFDAGTQATAGDVWWEQVDATTRWLVPQGGALITNLGTIANFDTITPGQLQSLTFSSSPINGSNNLSNQLVTGDIFAVRTRGGHWAKVQVLSYGYDLQIRWITYS